MFQTVLKRYLSVQKLKPLKAVYASQIRRIHVTASMNIFMQVFNIYFPIRCNLHNFYRVAAWGI